MLNICLYKQLEALELVVSEHEQVIAWLLYNSFCLYKWSILSYIRAVVRSMSPLKELLSFSALCRYCNDFSPWRTNPREAWGRNRSFKPILLFGIHDNLIMLDEVYIYDCGVRMISSVNRQQKNFGTIQAALCQGGFASSEQIHWQQHLEREK